MTRDEAMKVWREADRAGEDAYVDAIQAGAVTADDAHKAGSLVAATVIQQAFAERDGEIARLREVMSRARISAAMLIANAEGCIANHHALDFEQQGEPGWLSDARRDIDALSHALGGKA